MYTVYDGDKIITNSLCVIVILYLLSTPFVLCATERKNEIVLQGSVPQYPHGDSIDHQFAVGMSYLREINTYGKISYHTGILAEYNYLFSVDSQRRQTWYRNTYSILSLNQIRYTVTSWFSFAVAGSIGIEVQAYHSKKRHVGGFFAGNLHVTLQFTYNNVLFLIEGRSEDRFSAFGAILGIGYRF